MVKKIRPMAQSIESSKETSERAAPSLTIFLAADKKCVKGRTVVMAIEQRKFHHLIFDNRVFSSHFTPAFVSGVFLQQPSVKLIFVSCRYIFAVLKHLFLI
ncbi:MAG: hypothetical protein GY857_02485 [Desulfobacula sp.]|nr:hypothetical protein [Desulfobacula sp.]